MTRLVSTARNNKGVKKNHLTLPLQNYAYSQEKDFFEFLSRLKFVRFLPPSYRSVLPYLHYDIFPKTTVITHLFNRISYGKKPWIVTFESRVPRWGFRSDYKNSRSLRSGIRRLNSKNCKKLLAMSRCAYNVQSIYLDEHSSVKDEVLAKTEVFHPPQAPLISDYSEKSLSREFLTFTFVGLEFFRKGGLSILRAFDQLLQRNAPVELNIISSMSTGASGATHNDVSYARKLMAKYPHHIHYLSILPNHEVMNVLRNTHVALLPTLEDTYGYAVLEAQANGCPVVTTNVRALPEINNNDVGWMIDLPLDTRFFSARGFEGWTQTGINKEIMKVERLIEDGLVHAVEGIIDNPESVQQKGVNALARIRKHHNPKEKAYHLEYIYDKAVGI